MAYRFNPFTGELDQIGDVSSVNGQTGAVVLNAASVGAAPTSHTHAPEAIVGPNTNARVLGKLSGTTYGELILNIGATANSVPRRDASGQMTTELVPIDAGHVSSKQYVDTTVENAVKIGQAYTTANVVETRTIDADTAGTMDVANVLGTLINDLKAKGHLD